MNNNNLSPVKFEKALLAMNACSEAREWAEGKDYATAWDTCSKVNWMFFLINKIAPLSPIQNEQLICRFARKVVHLTDDSRVLACIETREAWIRGEVSDEVRATALSAAWDAALSAAWDAALSAAWDTAGAAAWDTAGSAARAAVWSAAWAAAGDTAVTAVGSAAWSAMSAIQCDIIRELVPRPLLG